MLELNRSSDGTARKTARVGTLGSHLDSRLSRLLRSLGQTESLSNSRRVARVLTSGWSHEVVYLAPQIYTPAPARSVEPALGLFGCVDEPRSLAPADAGSP
jgi:hypothetical protein